MKRTLKDGTKIEIKKVSDSQFEIDGTFTSNEAGLEILDKKMLDKLKRKYHERGKELGREDH